MAFDEGLAQWLRDDLTGVSGITERKMFGGLAFFHRGNMVCGVHKNGVMFRVGKSNESAAKSILGAKEMAFTTKKMGGMIDVEDDAVADDARRRQWMEMSLQHARNLPPKDR